MSYYQLHLVVISCAKLQSKTIYESTVIIGLELLASESRRKVINYASSVKSRFVQTHSNPPSPLSLYFSTYSVF